MVALLGYGKTTKALAKRIGRDATIFTDLEGGALPESDGVKILPTEEYNP
ncbi:MAG: UDP-N-acetylmuramoyl-L-alanine--D-glutamate ligase, partial [Epsilonproteobacteria bacterium]|nr:UDP-N-acetylmuramoyl-L-alanine--D-glutamate ligase [Campylobacterota bacterium]NPA56191.1 UDP-N-acetylmuramoyl-L-alanine--D-glutamate ligase [Campylobacterota bacterium]